ncbi:MAG: (2Fe-2S)-binding protein [Pseudomonadota bacterium]|nr:(2Fe-2S)-binding protein [Pseudomonadales bacterium]MDY6920668.1 (2Fe-2S)-binding protein [Pseudomonadota bacterium]
MYVCVCKAVTEKHIQQAVKSGVNDYRSFRDRTGVGSQCGKCGTEAKSCFRQHAVPQ